MYVPRPEEKENKNLTEERDTYITLYSEREDKDRENVMAMTSQSPME